MTGWLADALGVVVPANCAICGQGLTLAEDDLCLACQMAMPRTSIHLAATNRIAERVARIWPDVRVASWFYYRRHGDYAKLIHDIKYRDRPALGRRLGATFATEIAGDGFFDGLDVIVPVPMHWFKQLRRGFNQSCEIALGVSQATGIPLVGHLQARHGHGTQTRRNAEQRARNVRADLLRVVKPDELAGRGVLIVDDVITTGSTIEAAIASIVAAQPAVSKISVLSLAITEND